MRDACTWADEGGDFAGTYRTTCDNYFSIIDGTPSENGMRFCCYCGRPLIEKPYVENVEDDS